MKILLVCLGNICRSPMAEGILRHKISEAGLPWKTDSAGTGDYHVGEAPDRRAIRAMHDNGIDITDLRAQHFTADHFEEFDLLLAMDTSNLQNMLALAPNGSLRSKAKLMMSYAPGHPLGEVPDPYFGGDEGFAEVFDMLEIACTNLINDERK